MKLKYDQLNPNSCIKTTPMEALTALKLVLMGSNFAEVSRATEKPIKWVKRIMNHIPKLLIKMEKDELTRLIHMNYMTIKHLREHSDYWLKLVAHANRVQSTIVQKANT